MVDLNTLSLEQMTDANAARLFGRSQPGKYEKVIYYRSPQVTMRGEPYVQAGWIHRSDSQDSKQLQMMRKGWMPLEQFGGSFRSEDPWGPILAHPDGPRQFPLTQIMEYRWYDPTHLRHDWPSMPPGLSPQRVFPQLREAMVSGELVVKEYGCPNCHNRSFVMPAALYTHLNVHHDYSPEMIFELGQAMGIDFSVHLRARAVKSFEIEDIPENEPSRGAAFEDVPIVRITAPAVRQRAMRESPSDE